MERNSASLRKKDKVYMILMLVTFLLGMLLLFTSLYIEYHTNFNPQTYILLGYVSLLFFSWIAYRNAFVTIFQNKYGVSGFFLGGGKAIFFGIIIPVLYSMSLLQSFDFPLTPGSVLISSATMYAVLTVGVYLTEPELRKKSEKC